MTSNYNTVLKPLLEENEETSSSRDIQAEHIFTIRRRLNLDFNESLSTPPTELRKQISTLQDELQEAHEFHDLELQVLHEDIFSDIISTDDNKKVTELERFLRDAEKKLADANAEIDGLKIANADLSKKWKDETNQNLLLKEQLREQVSALQMTLQKQKNEIENLKKDKSDYEFKIEALCQNYNRRIEELKWALENANEKESEGERETCCDEREKRLVEENERVGELTKKLEELNRELFVSKEKIKILENKYSDSYKNAEVQTGEGIILNDLEESLHRLRSSLANDSQTFRVGRKDAFNELHLINDNLNGTNLLVGEESKEADRILREQKKQIENLRLSKGAECGDADDRSASSSSKYFTDSGVQADVTSSSCGKESRVEIPCDCNRKLENLEADNERLVEINSSAIRKLNVANRTIEELKEKISVFERTIAKLEELNVGDEEDAYHSAVDLPSSDGSRLVGRDDGCEEESSSSGRNASQSESDGDSVSQEHNFEITRELNKSLRELEDKHENDIKICNSKWEAKLAELKIEKESLNAIISEKEENLRVLLAELRDTREKLEESEFQLNAYITDKENYLELFASEKLELQNWIKSKEEELRNVNQVIEKELIKLNIDSEQNVRHLTALYEEKIRKLISDNEALYEEIDAIKNMYDTELAKFLKIIELERIKAKTCDSESIESNDVEGNASGVDGPNKSNTPPVGGCRDGESDADVSIGPLFESASPVGENVGSEDALTSPRKRKDSEKAVPSSPVAIKPEPEVGLDVPTRDTESRACDEHNLESIIGSEVKMAEFVNDFTKILLRENIITSQELKSCANVFYVLLDKYTALLQLYSQLWTEFEGFRLAEEEERFEIMNLTVHRLKSLCSQLEMSETNLSLTCSSISSFRDELPNSTAIEDFGEIEISAINNVTLTATDPLAISRDIDFQTPLKTPPVRSAKKDTSVQFKTPLSRISKQLRTPLRPLANSAKKTPLPPSAELRNKRNSNESQRDLHARSAAKRTRELFEQWEEYDRKIASSEEVTSKILVALETLEERISQFEDSSANSKMEREILETENEELKRRLSTKVEEMKELKEKLNHEIVSLNPQLRETLAEASVMDTLAIFMKTIVEACNKVRGMISDNLEEEIELLKRKLSESEEVINEAVRENGRLKAVNDVLAWEKGIGEKALSERDEQIRNLTSDVTALKATVKLLEERLRESDGFLKTETYLRENTLKDLERFKLFFEGVEKENVGLQQKIEQSEKLIDDLKGELHAAKREQEQIEIRGGELLREIEQLKLLLGETERQRCDDESQGSHAEEVEEKTAEDPDFPVKDAEERMPIEECDGEIALQLKTRLEDIEKEKAKVSSLESLLEEYREKEKAMLEDIEKLNVKLSTAESSLEEKTLLFMKISAELEEAKTMRTSDGKVMDALKVQLEELEEEKSKLDALEVAVEEYREKEKRMAEDTKELNAKLSTVESLLEEKASMFVKISAELEEAKALRISDGRVIDALKVELEELEREKSKLVTLETALEEYREREKAMAEDMRVLSSKLSTAETSLEEKASLFVKISAELEEAQTMRTSDGEVIDALKLQLQELEKERSKLIALEAALEEYREKERRMTEDIDALNVKLSTAETTLEEKTRLFLEVSAQLEEANAMRSTGESAVDALKVRLREIEEEKSKFVALESTVEEQREREKSMAEDVEALNKKLSTAEALLEEKTSLFTRLSAELEEAKAATVARENDAVSLRARLADEVKERTSLESTVEEYREKEKAMTEEMQALNAKLSSAETLLQEKTSLYTEISAELEEAKTTRASDERTVQALKVQLEELEREKSMLARLESELEECREKEKAAAEDLDVLRRKLSAAETLLEEKTSLLVKVSGELEETKAMRSSDEKLVDALRAQIDELEKGKSKSAELESRLVEYGEKEKESVEVIAALTARLEEAKTSLEEKAKAFAEMSAEYEAAKSAAAAEESALRARVEELVKERSTLEECREKERAMAQDIIALSAKLSTAETSLEEKTSLLTKTCADLDEARATRISDGQIIDALKGQLEEMETEKSKVVALECAAEEYKEKEKRMAEDVEALNAKLSTAETSLEEKTSLLAKISGELEEEKATRTRDVQAIASLNLLLEELEKEKSRLAPFEAALDECRERERCVGERVENLESKLGEREKSLEEKSAIIDRLNVELMDAKSEAAEYKAAEKLKADELENLNSKLASIEADLNLKVELIDAVSGNLKEAEMTRADHERRILVLSEEVARLNSEVADLQNVRMLLDAAEKESRDKDLAIEDFERKAKGFASSEQELNLEIDALNRKLRDAEESVNSQALQLLKLQEVESQLVRSKEIVDELLGSKDRCLRLEADLDAVKRELEVSDARNAELQAANRELSRKISDCEQINEIKLTEMRELREKICGAESSLRASKSERESIARELRAMEEVVAEREGIIARLKSEVSELKEARESHLLRFRDLQAENLELSHRLKVGEESKQNLANALADVMRKLDSDAAIEDASAKDPLEWRGAVLDRINRLRVLHDEEVKKLSEELRRLRQENENLQDDIDNVTNKIIREEQAKSRKSPNRSRVGQDLSLDRTYVLRSTGFVARRGRGCQSPSLLNRRLEHLENLNDLLSGTIGKIIEALNIPVRDALFSVGCYEASEREIMKYILNLKFIKEDIPKGLESGKDAGKLNEIDLTTERFEELVRTVNELREAWFGVIAYLGLPDGIISSQEVINQIDKRVDAVKTDFLHRIDILREDNQHLDDDNNLLQQELKKLVEETASNKIKLYDLERSEEVLKAEASELRSELAKVKARNKLTRKNELCNRTLDKLEEWCHSLVELLTKMISYTGMENVPVLDISTTRTFANDFKEVLNHFVGWVNSRTKQIRDLEEQVRRLEEANASEAELGEQGEEVRSLRSQLEALEKDCALLDKQRQQLTTELVDARNGRDGSNSELEQQLRDLQQSNAAFKKQVRELSEECESLAKVIKEAKKETEKVREQGKKEVKSLESQLEKLRQEHQFLRERDLVSNNSDSDSVKCSRCEGYARDLRELRRQLADKIAEWKELSDKHNALEQQVKELDEECEDMAEVIKKKQKETDRVWKEGQDSLKKLQSDCDKLKEENESLLREKEELLAKMDFRQGQNADANESESVTCSRCEGHCRNVKDLRSQLAGKIVEWKELSDKNNALEEKVKELEEANAAFEKQVKELDEECEDMAEVIKKKQKETDRVWKEGQDSLKKLQSECDKLKEENESLLREKEELLAKMDCRQGKNSDAAETESLKCSRCDGYCKDLKDLKSQLAGKIVEWKELSDKNNALEEKVKELEEANAAFEKQVKELDEECEDMAEVIKKKQKEADRMWKEGQDSLKKLQTEYDKLKEENESLALEKEELSAKVESWRGVDGTTKNSDAIETDSVTSNRFKVDSKAVQELKSGILLKDVKILKLQQFNEELEQQNLAYKSQVKYLDKSLEKLKKQIAEEKERNGKLAAEVKELEERQRRGCGEAGVVERPKKMDSFGFELTQSSGDKDKLEKLERDNKILKDLCRTRYCEIKRLETENLSLKGQDKGKNQSNLERETRNCIRRRQCDDSSEENDEKEESRIVNPALREQVLKHLARFNSEINQMSTDELIEQLKRYNLDVGGNDDVRRRRLKNNYRKIKLASVNIYISDKLLPFYVIIDFEATCLGEKNTDFVHEIIEFPAVLVSTQTSLEIVDTFQKYCKPRLNPQLSDFCRELTGITQEQVDSAEDFASVLKSFEEWLRKHDLGTKHKFAIVTDSPSDTCRFLYQQCHYSNIPYPKWALKWINMKRSFRNFYKCRTKGLENMLEYVGMEFVGRLHCGLDDATNISRLLIKMMRDGASVSANEKIKRASEPRQCPSAAGKRRESCGDENELSEKMENLRVEAGFTVIRNGNRWPTYESVKRERGKKEKKIMRELTMNQGESSAESLRELLDWVPPHLLLASDGGGNKRKRKRKKCDPKS